MSSFNRTRRINLLVLIALALCTVAWQPQKTHAAGGGVGIFPEGKYASRTMTYTYRVTGAPPNMCGTLNITRNGIAQAPGINWICTDGNGNATKGPWGPPTSDETATGIYILWADGSRTSGDDTHINDVKDPTITSQQSGGVGIPIPTVFNGTASDAQWGTGFKFGAGGWSYLYATFFKAKGPYDLRPDKYWSGSSYSSSIEKRFDASVSPSGGGHNITWAVAAPPNTAHTATDTYGWCVYTKDYFYPVYRCIYFHGPR